MANQQISRSLITHLQGQFLLSISHKFQERSNNSPLDHLQLVHLVQALLIDMDKIRMMCLMQNIITVSQMMCLTPRRIPKIMERIWLQTVSISLVLNQRKRCMKSILRKHKNTLITNMRTFTTFLKMMAQILMNRAVRPIRMTTKILNPLKRGRPTMTFQRTGQAISWTISAA